MKIATVGLNLAKAVFHVVCLDASHNEVGKWMLSRKQVNVVQMESCLVAMKRVQAPIIGGGSLSGCCTKLIPPQVVKL